MKPRQKRSASPQPVSGGPAAPSAQAVSVHRYSHPIRTKAPVQRSPEVEELLSGIWESLSRQEAALEELLRRTGGSAPDTMQAGSISDTK